MSKLKNTILRNRTEDFCEQANSFYETFQIGSDLEKIGGLIREMSMQIKYLQEKVDNQAEHIKALSDKGDTYPNLYAYAIQWNNISSKKVPYQFIKFVAEQRKSGKQETEPITCKECDIPDVNCYEQCRGCFGASFNDCEICDDRKEGD